MKNTGTDKRFSLEIDAPSIPAPSFARGVRAFFDLVDDLTRDVGGREFVSWNVRVREGSAIIEVMPELAADAPVGVFASIEGALAEGIQSLEAVAERPNHYSDNALKAVRRLGRISDAETKVAIRVANAKHSITHKSVANVNDLVGWTISDYGSIEGRLRTVSDQGNLHFFVFDDLTNRQIRCYFDDEQTDDVMKAWRSRVIVSGVVRYRKDGEPTSIVVDNLTPLKSSSDLPSADDVLGILKED